MNPRQLIASVNEQPVGRLAESGGAWEFTYADEWLARPDRFALSPHLPLAVDPITDGASLRPVQWYFDNLLPEEAQRQLMAADASIPSADAFGLLAYYGAESAGSLTLLPPGSVPEAGQLIPLTYEALSARIHGLPLHSLAAGAEKRMSLAGAQHKLPVVVEDDQLFQPAGAAPSTHILKPDHPDVRYAHSEVNEWFVMELARRMELEVPRVSRRYVPEPVYLIERFDRRHGPHGTLRMHAIDACQLLNLDRQFKYQQGSVEVLGQIADLCRNKLQTRWRLYDWLLFNVLTGNSDAHLKNLSFMVEAEGIFLSPHYDLLSTVVYESKAYDQTAWPEEATLAWPIMGAQRFAALDREMMLDAGEAMGLSRSRAATQMDYMLERLPAAAAAQSSEMEAENARLHANPETGVTLAGEARCIRVILHAVIPEMIQRLR